MFIHTSSLWIPFLWCVCAVLITTLYCRYNIVSLDDNKNKLILSWVPLFSYAFYSFGKGNPEDFVAAGCEFTNCRIIEDRKLLPSDRYDAVLFHGFEYYMILFGAPKKRSPSQLYIYVNLESPKHSEIPVYQTDFYDITMTYRLDSNILWPYFSIVDRWKNKDIAPDINPKWDTIEPQEEGSHEIKGLKQLVAGKVREAAWIASNCNSDSGREKYVEELINYGIEIDIYGRCGNFTCVRNQHEDCREYIARKYYFYLVFENSICVDYLTEKMITALSGGAVPVVLSGANLTRFLPPGSYLDARELGPERLAVEMRRLISDPKSYEKFLWWRTKYRAERRDPGFQWPRGKHPMCKLCDILQKPWDWASSKRIEVRNWWQTRPDNKSPACLTIT